jgi:hypothetical protein
MEKSGKITKFSFKERGYHQKPNNANDMDDLKRSNMLGYYLAGLIEGDGSIIVPKTPPARGPTAAAQRRAAAAGRGLGIKKVKQLAMPKKIFYKKDRYFLQKSDRSFS